MIVRLVLAAGGVLSGAYGLYLLAQQPLPDLASVAFWFVGGILLHDGVVAPMCVALGFAGRRILPRRWWAPVACGAACTATLVAIALPVVARRNALADNATVLDRNYVLGLLGALTLVWLVVAATIVATRPPPPPPPAAPG